MNRGKFTLDSNTSQRIALTRGNALVIQITGAGSNDGDIDFESSMDSANWANHPYITLNVATPTRSIAQIANPSTRTTYLMTPPVLQGRVTMSGWTQGSVEVVFREIIFNPVRSTDADAIAAVEGEATLVLGGDVTLQGLNLDDLVKGDILYGDEANSLAILQKANAGDVLTLASDIPSWKPPAAAALARIAGSTFSTVQHLQDIFHSAGWVSGGGITDDADGTITVAAGTGLIRATDSSVAELLYFDWAAESGAGVNLADNDISYVYVEYNGGSPQVVATTTRRTDFNTNVLLAVISRAGTTLDISIEDKHTIGDHANFMIQRMIETMPWARASGAIISATGTRNIALTAGRFWRGLSPFATAAFDSNPGGSADTYTLYRGDGSSGFTIATAEATINNTQYDDGAGGLGTVSVNKYGVFWVYMLSDGSVSVIFGVGDYTLSEAEDAQAPALVPEPIQVHGFIVGKVIIKKSDSVFTELESPFLTAFPGSVAADHGDLAGIGVSDHHTKYTDAEAIAAVGTPFTMHVVPGSDVVASGMYVLFVSMFKDTTGNPDRCVVVTVRNTNSVALVEYKRLGNAWVFDPADCARDDVVTLNFTVPIAGSISAFAIDNPASSGDRILFIAGANDDATDTFEIDSILLTPGGSSLTATAVVIAGTNQPTDTNFIATCGIPLSITRCMTFFNDDAHFADITETTGTYTFTYDDAKVLAVDTSILITSSAAKAYSGIVIGTQVLLLRADGIALAQDKAWEMSIAAVLTEEFSPFRAGGMGSSQSEHTLAPAVITAIGGEFAVAAPFGGLGSAAENVAYIVAPFPLDSI